MSNASHIQRAFAVIGLVGLLGAVSTSSASAFHFGGGGGFHPSAPHFGGGGFHPSVAHFGGGYHPSVAHFGGGYHPAATHFSGGGRRSFSAGRSSYAHSGHSAGRRQYASHTRHEGRGHSHEAGNHTSRGDHAGRREHGSPWAKVGSHCWGHHRCGGFGGGAYVPVVDAPSYDDGQASGAVYPNPVYVAPVMNKPAISTSVPVSAPVKTCDAGGTFVTVVFQPTATAAAITAFLKDYDVTLADGPNPDGMYRIKISAEKVTTDQFGEMIDSMRSKKDVVSAITVES